MTFAFDGIFVGVCQYSSVTNFIILGLGNRVSLRVSIRLIRYSAMIGGAI